MDGVVVRGVAILLLTVAHAGCGGAGNRSDGSPSDRAVGGSITYYDCTEKDSSGKLTNVGKPCASECGTMPDPAGFTWLYAYTDGTCMTSANGLGVSGICDYATMMTCGSTQGSTCSGGGDSGVNAHCN